MRLKDFQPCQMEMSWWVTGPIRKMEEQQSWGPAGMSLAGLFQPSVPGALGSLALSSSPQPLMAAWHWARGAQHHRWHRLKGVQVAGVAPV